MHIAAMEIVLSSRRLKRFLQLESAIRKIALTLYLGRWQSRARVKSVRRLTVKRGLVYTNNN
jgi:hypothetical protein